MKRETLKTVAGIVVIAAIVVATYLYGSAQRRDQQNREAATRQRQQTGVASPTTSPSKVVTFASPTTSPTGNGTAPVASTQPNTIQGGGTATVTPKPAATPTPAVSLSQGSLGTPAGQGSQALADTGPGLSTTLGATMMTLVFAMWLRSRQALRVPVRVRARHL